MSINNCDICNYETTSRLVKTNKTKITETPESRGEIKGIVVYYSLHKKLFSNLIN